MTDFSFPESMNELWSAMAEHPGAALSAGGTDLFVKKRAGKDVRPVLISLERIEELRGIRDEGKHVRIGAGVTHAALLGNRMIREHFPVLAMAVGTIGSPQIRNMGTIGGNICTASPAGDTLPPLHVLRAEVEIMSAEGSRSVPIASFITGPGKTDLKPNEILSALLIPKPPPGCIHHFEKIGQRKAMAIAVAGLAALLRIAPDGIVREARFAWGSVGPVVVVSPEIESLVRGRKLSKDVLREAAALAEKAVDPIDDVRGSAAYRRVVAGRLLLRLADTRGVS